MRTYCTYVFVLTVCTCGKVVLEFLKTVPCDTHMDLHTCIRIVRTCIRIVHVLIYYVCDFCKFLIYKMVRT